MSRSRAVASRAAAGAGSRSRLLRPRKGGCRPSSAGPPSGSSALAFSASGLVSWGLPLHLIALMQNAGLGQAEAVGVATLIGPATLLARLVDATLGERLPVERVALAGLLLGPLSCLAMARRSRARW